MSSKIRVGIDFDNTIICYDDLFHRAVAAKNWIKDQDFPVNKSGIKSQLIQEDGNDFRWQEIQAMVYGRLIKDAETFPFFIEAIQHLSKLENDELFVVSHKTKYSHYLKDVELIDSAKNWCELKSLYRFIPSNQWFFLPTRDEKIQKIKELELNVFIDDLEEVLDDPSFPEIAKFHFTPQARHGFNGWKIILENLKLLMALGPEGYLASKKEVNLPVTSFEMLRRDGNNKILKITDSKKKKFIVKKYSSVASNYSTLETEYKALAYLSQYHFPVPKPFLKNEMASFAIYESIEIATSAHQDQDIVRDFSEFLARLEISSKTPEAQTFPEARDSRKSICDYRQHIERRLKAIQDGCHSNGVLAPIKKFLQTTFSPLLERVMSNYQENLRRFSLDENTPLSRQECFLSPSDFGLHNSLFTPNAEFKFIDFEYFGWDDKAKLVADFIHHAGQNLSLETRLDVIREFSQKVALSDEFFMRLSTIIDLIGLEWILIVLNVADPQVLQRRMYANPDLNLSELITLRVEKAQQRADLCLSNIEANSVFITLNSNDPKMMEIQQWRRLITLT